MSALASVLPFLAALKKQVPDMSGPVDMSGNVSAPSQVAAAQQPPMGPPQASSIPQQDPQPDMSIGAPPAPPPQPPNPVGDIAQSMTQGQPPKLAPETKGHALLSILQGGLVGGLSGLASNAQTYAATGRNAGFGGGVGAGYAQTLPFQRGMQSLELQKAGLTNEQLIQMLPFLRAQQFAELGVKQSTAQKNTAEAQKNTAETGAVATKQALEAAQAEAANYKEDPNLGLIDLRTGQPVAGGAASAPLTPQEAAILGKQPGESVPLKIKNTANEMVNRGIKNVQANGRSLLVDNQGNTIKDMGQATPMAVINAQMAAPSLTATGALSDPNMETVAQAVAAGKEDMATALRPYMRFPGKANALEARILQVNPDYYQGDYQNRLKVLEKATQGSWADQKIAFNTTIQHAELLRQAAKEVNNPNSRTFASIANRLKTEFGDPDVTNLEAIINAYNHEVTSVISKGHITDTEVKTGGGTMPSNANPATVDKVLNSYQSLMKSKMGFLQKQIQAGMKGTQGLNDTTPAESGPTAADLLNKYPPKK